MMLFSNTITVLYLVMFSPGNYSIRVIFPCEDILEMVCKGGKEHLTFLELYHTKLQTSHLKCISFRVLISAVTFTAIMLCQACVLIKSVK